MDIFAIFEVFRVVWFFLKLKTLENKDKLLAMSEKDYPVTQQHVPQKQNSEGTLPYM